MARIFAIILLSSSTALWVAFISALAIRPDTRIVFRHSHSPEAAEFLLLDRSVLRMARQQMSTTQPATVRVDASQYGVFVVSAPRIEFGPEFSSTYWGMHVTEPL